jgi:tRNA (uracil-5-)-methyltransferase TRM9
MDRETQNELLEVVRRNYREIADDFSQTRQKYLWPEIIKLAGIVKNGDRVLDVGCGNGRLLGAWKDKNVDYLGVDASREFSKIAGQHYPERKFVVGDILRLGEIAEVDFDYVFCIAVLHHLPGRELRVAALKQLRNKIKSDGRIILSVWNLWSRKKYRRLIYKFALLKLMGKNKMDFSDIVFDWKNEAGKTRYYHAFCRSELRRIIEQSGLKIEKLYKDQYNYYAVLTV